LAAWLETDYVCDRRGRRYVPYWKPQGRVQIDWAQLQRWYRTPDHLLGNKETLEALKTIRQVPFRIDGKLRSGTTPGSPRVRRVPKAPEARRPPPPSRPLRRRNHDVVTNPKFSPCAARTYVETCQTWASCRAEFAPARIETPLHGTLNDPG